MDRLDLQVVIVYVGVYWGEPERAPHRRVCCKFSIYIYITLLVGEKIVPRNLIN